MIILCLSTAALAIKCIFIKKTVIRLYSFYRIYSIYSRPTHDNFAGNIRSKPEFFEMSAWKFSDGKSLKYLRSFMSRQGRFFGLNIERLQLIFRWYRVTNQTRLEPIFVWRVVDKAKPRNINRVSWLTQGWHDTRLELTHWCGFVFISHLLQHRML